MHRIPDPWDPHTRCPSPLGPPCTPSQPPGPLCTPTELPKTPTHPPEGPTHTCPALGTPVHPIPTPWDPTDPTQPPGTPNTLSLPSGTSHQAQLSLRHPPPTPGPAHHRLRPTGPQFPTRPRLKRPLSLPGSRCSGAAQARNHRLGLDQTRVFTDQAPAPGRTRRGDQRAPERRGRGSGRGGESGSTSPGGAQRGGWGLWVPLYPPCVVG